MLGFLRVHRFHIFNVGVTVYPWSSFLALGACVLRTFSVAIQKEINFLSDFLSHLKLNINNRQ